MTDCGCPDQARERLEDLIHNELCNEDAADIREHIASCDSCAGEHNLGVVLTEVISRACKEQAPEQLRDQVLASLRAVQAEH